MRKRGKNYSLDRINVSALYVFLAPALALTLVFGYLPMFSNVIAFLDYKISNGWFGLASPFVGFRNFSFIKEEWFHKIMLRTLWYSFSGLFFGFPASLILALMFNELRSHRFKKIVQTVSYVPNFVSWVTIAGLVYTFLSYEPDGILNNILEKLFHMERVSYMQDPKYFLTVLILTGIWKGAGWGTIMYMAAISTIDEQIYEAAEVDGAGRFAKMMHITFPGLIPIFCILLIFSMGGLFNTNFDQMFNLQNAVLRDRVHTIDLYTYFNGVVNGQYSLSTAVGLFQGVTSMILVLGTNYLSKKLSGIGVY